MTSRTCFWKRPEYSTASLTQRHFTKLGSDAFTAKNQYNGLRHADLKSACPECLGLLTMEVYFCSSSSRENIWDYTRCYLWKLTWSYPVRLAQVRSLLLEEMTHGLHVGIRLKFTLRMYVVRRVTMYRKRLEPYPAQQIPSENNVLRMEILNVRAMLQN